MTGRLRYWRRIAASYLLSSRSQLTFWHETPEVNPNLKTDSLGEYYMTFARKADHALATGDAAARDLFRQGVRTLRDRLGRYDAGFWSLYEQSGTWMRMIASPFYHRLHVVQLRVMHGLTGEGFFAETADRWEGYTRSFWNRSRAKAQKAVFKVFYY